MFHYLINKKIFYVKCRGIDFSHFPGVTWECCEPTVLFGNKAPLHLLHFNRRFDQSVDQRSLQLFWQEYEIFWAPFYILIIVQSLTCVNKHKIYPNQIDSVSHKFENGFVNPFSLDLHYLQHFKWNVQSYKKTSMSKIWSCSFTTPLWALS